MALVEVDALGGTCLNRGCIPAKAFLETAAVHRHVAHAGEFGIEASAPSVNFAVTQERKQKIVAGLVGGVAAMCKGRKVEVFNGIGLARPRPHRHRRPAPTASTTQITGTNVILAAGSVPRMIPGFERGGPIMTSDEVLDLDHVPGAHGRHRRRRDRLRVRLARSPTSAPQVTILEGLPKILPGLDNDLANVVVRSFKKKNIDIRTGVKVMGHTPNDAGRHHRALRRRRGPRGRCRRRRRSAGARSPTSSASTAPACKVDERGFVDVDEFCRTGEDGVYAIGDLINTPQLAHVGYAEAILCVKQILGETAAAGDVRPGAVGDLLRSRGGVGRPRRGGRQGRRLRRRRRQAPVQVQPPGPDPRRRSTGCARSSPRRARTASAGRVLGVHMVGPWVTEQLSGGYLAVNWEATVAEVAEFIQPHPSLTELFGETVLSLTGRNFNA